jgi:hypothetical protein
MDELEKLLRDLPDLDEVALSSRLKQAERFREKAEAEAGVLGYAMKLREMYA